MDLDFRYKSLKNNREYSRHIESEKDMLIDDLYKHCKELEVLTRGQKKSYEDKPNWNINNVMDFLDVSKSLVLRLVHEKQIQAIVIGGKDCKKPTYRFPREAVYNFRDACLLYKLNEANERK